MHLRKISKCLISELHICAVFLKQLSTAFCAMISMRSFSNTIVDYILCDDKQVFVFDTCNMDCNIASFKCNDDLI